MRLQAILAPAVVVLGVAGLARPEVWLAAGAGAAGFLAAAVPYARFARRQGAGPLAAAPIFLFVRALALDAGLLAGWAHLAAGRHPAGGGPRLAAEAAGAAPWQMPSGPKADA
jgi:hypothetical protein